MRIAGFRRENIFGPDQAAEMLASAGVSCADSLGQGLFEHLVLCRKFVVVPVFEAPAAGFPVPFLQSELVQLRPEWDERVIGQVAWRVEAELDTRAHGLALRNLSQVLGWAGKHDGISEPGV